MIQSSNIEKWVAGFIVCIFILSVYLMLPTGSVGVYVDDNQTSIYSKQSFRVDYENYVALKQKEVTSTTSTNYSSTGGQKIADIAMSEFEYFSTHNLSGGMRYWRWFNRIPSLVQSNKSVREFEPLENSEYVSGVVPVNGGYEWCNIFVSCIAQEAGYSSGALYGGSGAVCMGMRCTDTFNWCINNGSTGYVLSNSNLYKHINIFKTQCTGNFELVDSFQPMAGDLILFYNSGSTDGRFSHIGIVYAVNGNTVITIEGNTGSGGCTKSKVQKKEYELSNPRISGYIRPPYERS